VFARVQQPPTVELLELILESRDNLIAILGEFIQAVHYET
jgi:hypothetical protein